jgi:hypothetical protein
VRVAQQAAAARRKEIQSQSTSPGPVNAVVPALAPADDQGDFWSQVEVEWQDPGLMSNMPESSVAMNLAVETNGFYDTDGLGDFGLKRRKKDEAVSWEDPVERFEDPIEALFSAPQNPAIPPEATNSSTKAISTIKDPPSRNSNPIYKPATQTNTRQSSVPPPTLPTSPILPNPNSPASAVSDSFASFKRKRPGLFTPHHQAAPPKTPSPASLQRQVKNKEIYLTALESELRFLRRSQAQATTTIASLQQQLTSYKFIPPEHEVELYSLRSQVRQLSDVAKGREAERVERIAECRRVGRELEALKRELDEERRQNAMLRVDLGKARTAQNKVNNEMKRAGNELGAMKLAVGQLLTVDGVEGMMEGAAFGEFGMRLRDLEGFVGVRMTRMEK